MQGNRDTCLFTLYCVFSTTVLRYLFRVVVGVLKVGQKKGSKAFSLIESNNEHDQLSIPIRAQVKGHLKVEVVSGENG